VYDRTDTVDILKKVGNTEAVFTNETPLKAGTIGKCSNLKYFGVIAMRCFPFLGSRSNCQII
jgi:glycerate dehydrogenase